MNKVKAQLVGIDANDFMTEFAKKRTADFPEISYLHENIFNESFKKLNFDVKTMTLFCHHFEDETLTKFFQQFGQQAKKAIIINDLHRHWLAYYSIAWLTALFSKSYLVKNDAKLSVWRGFSRKELQDIIEKAGFSNYTIKWRWAFRWQVVISCER